MWGFFFFWAHLLISRNSGSVDSRVTFLCHAIEDKHRNGFIGPRVGSSHWDFFKTKYMIFKTYINIKVLPLSLPPCSFTLHRAPALRAQSSNLIHHPESGEKADSRFLRAGAVSQWWLMGGVTTGHLAQCTRLVGGSRWLPNTSWALLFLLHYQQSEAKYASRWWSPL